MDEGIGRMSPLFDLSAHRIPGHDACYYIPDFLTEKEEEYLIRKIEEYPQQRWKQLTNRRLQLWGGELTSKNVLISQAMPPFVNAYPDIIDRLKGTGAFTASPHGKPNHIIMNEYLPGQGIMPHEDGPAYFPVVATISLGSHCIFHYYQYKKDDAPERAEGRSIDSTPVLSVLLEPRSVVISEGALYRAHLHAIREIEEDVVTAGNAPAPPMLTDLGVPVANWDKVTGADTVRVMSEGGALKRATRYSLTCRDVEKVSQLKAFIKR
ncbi:hypothetical protein B0H15DRAFT_833961 [Mycena belliarum]|uniref:Fe2OG dioxygenase domain-containing protein n=1 Tax=Mycena belliarum TaxID=1033014 RepID=A0AAD6UBQ9_9AGAR|nr:hypothetical protein B0H15DRAFT_833961 [Mycena belliae]